MFADLTKRSLDGVGVFEEGQEERRGREGGRAERILDDGALALVIVTELVVAKCGRPALRSVLFCVLALRDRVGHYDCSLIKSAVSSRLSVLGKTLLGTPNYFF
jgi:hypothetical protein